MAHTIVTGDWNSTVGKDYNRGLKCMGIHGKKTMSNKNGIKITFFCIRNDLIIRNMMWKQRMGEEYTHVAEERILFTFTNL